MGRRLLPNTLLELYAHAIAVEREAAKRFAELERSMRDAGIDHIAQEFAKIGGEEREQYEALALGTADRKLPELRTWEYAWHFLGPQAEIAVKPKNARDALKLALASERRAQRFYTDVAEHSMNDSVCAFAAEMAVDEQRHVKRLEALLAREPEPAQIESADDADGASLP